VLQRQIRELPSLLAWSRLYNGKDGAEAMILQDLRSIAGASGAAILVSSEASVSQGGLERYALRMQGSLDAPQLQSLIDRLRSHSKYLRIEAMHLTSPAMQVPDSNPPIAMDLQVIAFALPSEGGNRVSGRE
jgi:hypothetical protein